MIIPLKIKSLHSSHPPPAIVKVKIEVDSNAERIQKKHIASILNTITPMSTKLNIVMQFDIRNIPHQALLEKSTELLLSNGKKGIIEITRIAE